MERLNDLLAQRAKLDEEIKNEAKAVAAKLHAAGVNVAALASVPARRHAAAVAVPPKYRDISTPATWSGRGIKPKWLQARLNEGYTLDRFLIPA